MKTINVEKVEYDLMLATSSAAGGLKMTVQGLVYDMTAKAAKEAAFTTFADAPAGAAAPCKALTNAGIN